MRISIIDLGTHTVLLLTVDVIDGTYSIVSQEQRIVGLGRGIEKTGLINNEALSETLKALEEYKSIIKNLASEKIIMTATAVLRDASNSLNVKNKIEESTGFSIKILSGDEEAGLVYLAGTNAFPGISKAVVIDIGGGSVEFVEGKGKNISRLISLPLGVVKLTERFITRFPVVSDELVNLESFLDDTYKLELKGFDTEMPHVIGVAGTFTTAAAMIQGLEKYDPAKITGSVIKKQDAFSWLKRVSDMSIDEQKNIPGLHPKRAGFIVAGFALIHSFFNLFNVDAITVSDEGLRFGVLIDCIKKNQLKR